MYEVSSVNGLRKHTIAPALRICFSRRSVRCADTTTIKGVPGMSASRRWSSSPLMPGIRRFMIMQAGVRSVPAPRNAAAEANASVRQPFERRTQLMASRREGSSSMPDMSGTSDVIALDIGVAPQHVRHTANIFHGDNTRVVPSTPLHLGPGCRTATERLSGNEHGVRRRCR